MRKEGDMAQREFFVNLSVNLGNLWNPTDIERSQVITYLKMAIDNRAVGKNKMSECAMNAASELVKRMIQNKKEAGI